MVQRHQVKQSADGLARQATRKLRSAGLVRDSTGDADLSEMIAYAFDEAIVYIDREIPVEHRTEIVQAACEISPIYTGVRTSAQQAGNGYQLHIPGAKLAGFALGDANSVSALSQVVVLYKGSGSQIAETIRKVRERQTTTV